ncbi:MAG: hypothetical protein RIQ33_1955, partial [Bacteroidota bacterium]
IKQKYFKGYFDKFNIEFYVLKGHQKVADYKFRNLDSICTSANIISEGLFYSENKLTENQYYSKINICDSHKNLATIFISFNSKSFKKDKIYPSLIIEQKANSVDYLEQINFAIYSHHQLIRQSGNFAFPMELSKTEIPQNGKSLIFKKDKFQNLIVQSDSGKIIWITDYDKDLFQYLSLFGLMLIITFFTVVMITSGFRYQQFTTFYFSFRNKVLLVISSITLLILISTAVLFAVFYSQQFNDLLRINLSYKINNVQKDLMLSIDNSDHKRKFHSVDEASIDELIQHLSAVHDVDINLFEPNGNLKTSSQALIYENGILNSKINYKVLQSIIRDKKSLIFHDEQIGKLNFLSAYLPITNDKNEVKYILSVPYFFREKELTDNFYNLIITLLNLYLLLILVAILTAILISNNLTKSFEIIRKKLAALTLGQRNEPIVWHAKDEIGALVNEYNKMIAELENSTLKLAQSERESAWREMARQVAHEIKNPLTPMKLSVQLLERAIKDKRDDVTEMTIKVSKTLIEQIDNLTHIATQFSQFAKMGSSNLEHFNVIDILKNVVDLFSQHNPLVEVKFESKISETIIIADKNQCVSVFNNLVLNAIQSIPENANGQVIVKQYIENKKCIIIISDNGCGIEQDKLERIFEPNFTTKTSGTGLGLAISKTIIENFGGSISVKSELENGTEFRIEFVQ